MTTAFWIASGGNYVEEAQESAASFKRHNPGCKTALFGETQGGFDLIAALPPRSGSHWYLDSVEYFACAMSVLIDDSQLIYFDTDTYTLAPLDDLIALIGRYDIIGAHAPARQTAPTVKRLPDAFPEINIGVLGIYNTTPMRAFTRSWARWYRQHAEVYGNNDQAPLREMLWMNPEVLLYVMPPEYNCRFGFGGFAAGPIKVLHNRGYSFERAAEYLNGQRGMRAWRGEDLP